MPKSLPFGMLEDKINPLGFMELRSLFGEDVKSKAN